MPSEVITAIIAMIGTLIGSFGGIITSSRLTTYRLKQLEDKVKEHNNLVSRMVVVEQSTKSAHHRIDEIVEEVHYEH